MEWNSLLPPAEIPAHTEGYEGFYHLCQMSGDEEHAELIDASGFTFSGAEFLKAAQNYDPALHPTGGTSLEGYFVPGTYEMSRGISLDDFLANFMGVFRRRIKEPLETAFSANGLDLREAVIMASMIARFSPQMPTPQFTCSGLTSNQ